MERPFSDEVTLTFKLFQSTLPCGARPICFYRAGPLHEISIHAPRAGSDAFGCSALIIIYRFQSTLPVRGATMDRELDTIKASISIHAPRAGSDCESDFSLWRPRNFNPRSPCGERPIVSGIYVTSLNHFNPRSPCGERRAGCETCSRRDHDFNPRSPCGARP